nr:Wnt3 protein [Cladonema pacificum]
MFAFIHFCYVVIFIVALEQVYGQLWLALGTQSNVVDQTKRSIRNKNLCKQIYLHSFQREMCYNFTDLIPSVAEGVRLSIDECQEQFRNRKWNCSVSEEENSVFGPMISTASRESAFISGITSAGVAYAVTEACAEGKSVHCRCDNSIRGQTDEGWRWGGCNRPISYGIWFSQLFIDQVEHLMKKRRHPRKFMNLHNNRAGREIIRHNLWTKCKCHGMSGNCNLKTCWLAQPKFSEIGRLLKDRYDSAHEMMHEFKVKKNKKKKFKRLVPKYKEYLPPSTLDFIYYEESPDYCVDNKMLGLSGTKGRECNITSSSVDGCELMCCNRGYNVDIVQETKSCKCKFIWCCQVQCQKCTQAVAKYTCK